MNGKNNDCHISPAQADCMAPKREPLSDSKRYFLSIFVVVYFLGANLIAATNLERFKKVSARPVIHSVAVLFGIDQLWGVFDRFRPMNYHSSAVITFGDGAQRLYEFPRFDKMSEPEKFRHSKLRMTFYDFMANQKGEPFRPSIARYIACCNANPLNQPTFVTFYFNYGDIPKPTQSQVVGRSKNLSHSNRQPYFVYAVRR